MRNILKIIFVLHFCIIFSYLIGDLYKIGPVQKFTRPYTIPIFEQYWGMFSIPPTSTRKIFFQYRISDSDGNHKISEWYDINESMYRLNKEKYFSVAQRLIKYESSCINNILTGMIKCGYGKEMVCVENTEGYKSLKQYAKVVYDRNLKNDDEYLVVSFKLKILEDFFPDYEHRNLDFYDEKNHFLKHYTSEFRPID